MKKLFFMLFAIFFCFSFLEAQTTDPCHNRSFESDFDGYDGESGLFNVDTNDESCNFGGQYYSNPLGTGVTSDFTIINGAGSMDPFITVIPLRSVYRGEKTARINDSEVGYNIDKLNKTFVVPALAPGETYVWYYSFALVLENPAGHNNIQPFFQVKLCADDGTCSEVLCLDAELANNLPPANQGMDVQATAGTPIVFRDWACESITFTEDQAGLEFTVEFIASDCGAGAHWGYAYVDALCEPCGPRGSISLNPISDICEQTLPLEVSGTLDVPVGNGITGSVSAENIQLHIAHEGGGAPTVLSNPVLNYPDFTFTITDGDIPLDGCYDFRASVSFEYGGTLQGPIFSTSANPNDNVNFYNDYCTNKAICECDPPSITVHKREGGTCIPASTNFFSISGDYILPNDPTNVGSSTVQEVIVNIYHATTGNTPFNPSDLALGPITTTINELNSTFQTQIDLSLLPFGCYHLEVIGFFECNGEPMTASYVSFYNFCYSSLECTTPSITLDSIDGACVNIEEGKIKISGQYIPPTLLSYTGQLISITLRLSASGQPVIVIPITDIDLVAQTFCLELTSDLLPDDLAEVCRSLFVYAEFQLLENSVFTNTFVPASEGICFSSCCDFSVEGEGFCSLSTCDNFGEYAHITVRKAPSCGPGGYVRATFLTPGNFFNPNTGNTSTSTTSSMNNYNGFQYYASLFKPIHDFNGDVPNCFLVEIFTDDDGLIHSEEICFDIDCLRGERSLSTEVNCHPVIPDGLAKSQLTFKPADQSGKIWVSYDPIDAQDGVCTYVKVEPSSDGNCCQQTDGDDTPGDREFCLLVESNPFLINFQDWEAVCANLTLYKQLTDSSIELVAEGCYAVSERGYQVSLDKNPVSEEYLRVHFEKSLPDGETCKFTVVSETGKQFLIGRLNEPDGAKVNISTLPNGIYILNLNFDKSGHQENILFIRQK